MKGLGVVVKGKAGLTFAPVSKQKYWGFFK